METLRSVVMGLLMLALASSVNSRTLEEENAYLHRQLDEQSRASEIAHNERIAAVASACEALVRLCPDAMIGMGRQARAAGYGGGTTAVYWAVFIIKFLPPFIIFFLVYILYRRLVCPAIKDIEEAEKLIAESRAINDSKKSEARELETRIATLRQEHKQLDQELRLLQEGRAWAEASARAAEEASQRANAAAASSAAEAARWEQEAKAQRVALAALRAFD